MTRWHARVAQLIGWSRAFWLRMSPLLIGVLLSAATVSAIDATQLSLDQERERYFGASDGFASAGTSTEVGESDGPLPAIPDVTFTQELAAFVSFQPPGPQGEIYVVEADHTSAASRGRYELVSGRWPVRAGEVVATASTALSAGASVVPVVGTVQLRVVGMFRIVYSTRQRALLAAPGTWAQWRVSQKEAQLSQLRANRSLFFSGADSTAICATLTHDRSLLGDSFECQINPRHLPPAESATSVRSLLERGMPAVLLATLGAVLSGALLSRSLRRTFNPLLDLGLPRRTLHRLGTGLVVVAGLATAIAAATLGALSGFALRPLLQAQVDHPLSPPSVPLAALAGTLAAWVTLVLVTRPVETRRRNHAHMLSARAASIAAGLGSIVLAFAASVTLLGSASFATVGLIVGGICLGLALYVPSVVLRLSRMEAPPGSLLAAVRALGANSRGFSLHVGMIACLVGLVSSTLALAAGLVANLNENSGTGLPPGIAMLNIAEDGKSPLPVEVVERFRRELQLGEPVMVWRGVDEDPQSENMRPWWAFSTAADARTVLPWISSDQVRLLQQSGRLETAAPDQPARPDAVALPWAMRWLTEIRVSSAAPKGTVTTSLAFAGLSSDQDVKAASWARETGIADGYVWTTDVAPDVPVAALTALSTSAFAVLTAALSAVAMRGEVASMRSLLATFHAIGLGARWCRQVILLLAGITAGLAVCVSLAATVLCVLAVDHALKGALLVAGIPWHVVAAVSIATLLGACVGAVASTFRFRAHEHNTR